MSYERPNLSPAERQLDRPRSDAYYRLKATLIDIQRPGMNLDDVEHAIENLRRAMDSLESYAEALENLDDTVEAQA